MTEMAEQVNAATGQKLSSRGMGAVVQRWSARLAQYSLNVVPTGGYTKEKRVEYEITDALGELE